MQMRNDELPAVFSACRGFTLWVGFSGGADSTAALLLTCDAAAKLDASVVAVHFNHHLRGAASDAEAEAAAKFASELGVEFRCFDLHPEAGPGVEARARAMRLAVWRELAGNRPDAAVVLGHHRDDRVENLFLRLTRGANASGLTGLRPDTVVDGVRFLRPLLRYGRAEVEAFLRARGVTAWAEDASNLDPDAAFRNALRNRILPELYAGHPGSREGVAAALDALEEEAEFLESEAALRMAEGDPADIVFWQSLPPALTGRCLRAFLLQKTGMDVTPNRAGILRWRRTAAEGADAVVPLAGGVRLRLAAGRVDIDRDAPPDAAWRWREQAELRWGGWLLSVADHTGPLGELGADAAEFDPDALPEVLTVGAPREGEKMTVFGSKRRVKIKTLRIDRKVPAFPHPPVVRGPDGEALWVPRVRRSAAAPVRPGGPCVRFFAKKAE